MLDHIKTFVESLPSGVFPLLAASLGLSAFQQKLHTWLSVQSRKIKQTISIILAVLIVLLPHGIGVLAGNAQVLGAYTAMVLAAMTVFYNFLIKETPAINADLGTAAVQAPASVVVTPSLDPAGSVDSDSFELQ